MKTLIKTLVALSILMFHDALWADSQQQSFCRVPMKGSGLAIDQRDDLRLTCLKKRKAKLTVDQCLKIATSMEYSVNAEEARFICVTGLNPSPSAKECFKIAAQMEYPDSGDEVRWECLLQHGKKVSPTVCLKTAKAMNYPANEERATLFCKENLE